MAHKKEDQKADCYGDEVREHILEFAESGGYEAIPEEEREEEERETDDVDLPAFLTADLPDSAASMMAAE